MPPESTSQSQNKRRINSVSVSRNLQIAAGGDNQDITLYELDPFNKFKLLKTFPFGTKV
jgi:hypothetical protein